MGTPHLGSSQFQALDEASKALKAAKAVTSEAKKARPLRPRLLLRAASRVGYRGVAYRMSHVICDTPRHYDLFVLLVYYVYFYHASHRIQYAIHHISCHVMCHTPFDILYRISHIT